MTGPIYRCPLHAGVISISGNADEEIIVTGDVDRLRFRL